MPRINARLSERLEQLVPRRRHHEHVYPEPDGEGTAGGPVVVATNADDNSHGAASSVRWYWGETVRVLGTNVVEELYFFDGVYLTILNAASKDIRYHGVFYRIDEDADCSARNAGNAWDEGATVLTVADGTKFLVNDLVWIFSSTYMDGEIQRVTNVAANVVTVEREAMEPGWGAADFGLRWNHTADGANETMYLIYRPTCSVRHGYHFEFEAPSARETLRYTWPSMKTMPANAGIIVRAMNCTDDADNLGFDCKVIYNHT